VGCKFLICGDFDGQLLPMFDRWADVYNKKGILQSRLMYDLVNGLDCNLSVCRRTIGDQGHFHAVKELYNRQYFRPGEPVDEAAFARDLKRSVEEYMMLYRIDKDRSPPPDVVATMSHSHRLLMNALLNTVFAERQLHKKWLPWTEGKIVGATMQPQSCYVWAGMIVMGCTRGTKGRDGDVTNGVNYIVKSLGKDGAKLQMHPDYAKNYAAKIERNFPKLEPIIPGLVKWLREAPRTENNMRWYQGLDVKIDKGLIAFSALRSLGFVAVNGVVQVPAHIAEFIDDADVEPSVPDEIMGPEEFDISWENFQRCVRLTHALPYVYYQGKTVANQILWLMNVESKHFTMRHLIMGLGRVQTAKNVRICARGRELKILDIAKNAFEEYERRARSEAAPEVVVADVVVDADGDVVMEEPDEAASIPDPFADVDFDDDVAANSDEESVNFADPFEDVDFDDI